MEKMLKKVTLGVSWEIWCSNREAGRFDEKLGDSPENRETVGSCTLTPYHDPSDLGS